jgi:hypothetical protein
VKFALYEAIAAVAIGAVVSGDTGAPEDTAHLNSTHVVGVADIGGDDDTGNDCLYKAKCISSLKNSHALSLGSVANRGAPAPMGHRNAFGNTAEHMRCLVYGCAKRGQQHQSRTIPPRHGCGMGGLPQGSICRCPIPSHQGMPCPCGVFGRDLLCHQAAAVHPLASGQRGYRL